MRGARSAFLVFLAIVATGPHARGEIAILSSGKILYIDRYQREDQKVTLFLAGGGEVTCSFDLVVNIVPNEILPEPEGELADRAANLPLLPQLGRLVNPIAVRHGVDPRLVAALIWVESSGDPRAVSRKGARGLMQLMPETARRLGVTDILNPEQNVEGGVRYLREMLDRHGEDLSLALAAYNAGPEAVARHGGLPPFRETRLYVEKILELYRRASSIARTSES